MRKKNEYSFLEQLSKDTYVWFEDNRENETKVHEHQLAQFIYVAKGFQYLYTAEKVYLLPQHFAAWIPANTPHKTSSNANELDLRSIFYKVNSSETFYQDIHVFHTPNVLREMVAYAEKWNQETRFSVEEQCFLRAIFLEMPFFCQQNLQLQLPTPNNQNLQELTTYLLDRLSDDLSVGELAIKFHFSERSLLRMFKKETGLTVAKYIQYVRVMKSIELLGSGLYNISEVAFMVGYKSIQAFSSSFYEIVKQRPTSFLAK